MGKWSVLILFSFPQVSFAAPYCHSLFQKRISEHSFARQENEYFCGPAVLQAVLGKQGMLSTQQALAKKALTTPEHGTTPENMVKALKEFQLESSLEIIKGPLELSDVLKGSSSVIALIKSEGEAHWVIIDSFTGQGIKVLDPWLEKDNFTYLKSEDLFKAWDVEFMGERLQNLAIVAW